VLEINRKNLEESKNQLNIKDEVPKEARLSASNSDMDRLLLNKSQMTSMSESARGSTIKITQNSSNLEDSGDPKTQPMLYQGVPMTEAERAKVIEEEKNEDSSDDDNEPDPSEVEEAGD
jgi:hypothetical protein